MVVTEIGHRRVALSLGTLALNSRHGSQVHTTYNGVWDVCTKDRDETRLEPGPFSIPETPTVS